MKPVDQVRNSLGFLEDPTHEHAFDTLIWGLRERRDAAAREVPEWEDLRTLASRIKEHTLSHLADYLEQFEQRATANGARVHWPGTRTSTTRSSTTSSPLMAPRPW